MLTLSFNFFAFVRVSVKREKKIQKLFSFAGWRKERSSRDFFQTEKNRIFFSSRDPGERNSSAIFLLPSSNFWTLIKKEERVKMAASVSWSQRWLRPEVSDSRSSSFFETTMDDTC